MKKTIVSGIQPSGRLHIGNYFGALKNFVDLQNSQEYQCYFMVVDYHSITKDFDPKEKKQQIIDLAASYLASGLLPRKSTLLIQSHIPAHTELAWIFNTLTPMGELNRMTQFKDKSETGNINAGLLTYPTLMAADILLYHADTVPVGDDQLQHLELTRIIARKFNSRFGDTFVEPQALMTKTPRIMSLSDPTKKMSKSQPNGCLFIDGDEETARKKIMSAITDSDSEIRYDPKDKAGISNLLEILSSLTEKSVEDLASEFAGKNYGDLKTAVGDEFINYFTPFRKTKTKLLKNPAKIQRIFAGGAKKANKVAKTNLTEIKSKIGLV